MNIELRCLRFEHPGRNLSERSVWEDDRGNRLTAKGYASPERHHRPEMRMKAVVDLNFIVLLIVGTM